MRCTTHINMRISFDKRISLGLNDSRHMLHLNKWIGQSCVTTMKKKHTKWCQMVFGMRYAAQIIVVSTDQKFLWIDAGISLVSSHFQIKQTPIFSPWLCNFEFNLIRLKCVLRVHLLNSQRSGPIEIQMWF